MVLIMKFTTNNAEDRMTEHKAPPQLHPFLLAVSRHLVEHAETEKR